MKTQKSQTPQRARWVNPGKWLLNIFAMSTTVMLQVAPLRALDTEVETEDDAVITTEVKRALLFHLLMKTITETSNGVVTLRGEAGSAAEKELNTRLAAEIIGVKGVLNHMNILGMVARND